MSIINKKIKRFCKTCNKIFYVIPSTIKKGYGKFCSLSCRQNVVESFWANVDIKENINECWEWKKGKSKNGYGKITYQKKYMRSHRLAYFLTFPEQDTEENRKLIVRHYVCDNPPCCNPYHLKLGTNLDNSLDMVNKNRQAKGEKQGSVKLDEFDVKQILLLQNILKTQTIAEMYKISNVSVYNIFNNISWKYINRIKYTSFSLGNIHVN